MKKLWQRFMRPFCHHETRVLEVESWRWVRYQLSSDTAWDAIRIIRRCKRCGERSYVYLFSPEDTWDFAEEYADLQEVGDMTPIPFERHDI